MAGLPCILAPVFAIYREVQDNFAEILYDVLNEVIG